LSGVFDFAKIDDCACEPLPSASTRVRFGVACVSSKLHKRFGASPLARGVDTTVLLGVGEKNDTSDEYSVFATGVIAARAGVGGGS
jgi:hypothetical protein